MLNESKKYSPECRNGAQKQSEIGKRRAIQTAHHKHSNDSVKRYLDHDATHQGRHWARGGRVCVRQPDVERPNACLDTKTEQNQECRQIVLMISEGPIGEAPAMRQRMHPEK